VSTLPYVWRSAPEYPIPDRLNVALSLVVVSAAVLLLWVASQAEHWYVALGVGIAFSYLMLTDYALLHEATHGNLHTSDPVNYALGLVTGAMFPIPFTMIRTTHQGHHLRNRTDFELFDQFYPNEGRLVRTVQWYGILCGLFWPWVPIGSVLFALCPGVLRTRIFRTAKSSRHLLGDIRDREVRAIRLEVLFIVTWFAALFWLLSLEWKSVLICYACFSFNWSTRQYVGHAFSPRDVVEGAWNLRHVGPMSWLLMHGEYDLNHHRRPDVPWIYLPRFGRPSDPRPSYWKQYFRQWLGPQRCSEPAPESIAELPLSVHIQS
jgi:fatty acid desaturase